MTINYKVFAAGDTLSANDLLTYIENQAVIQVDNEAELTTLHTTYPSVRVAFAQDTDKLYVKDDGVWEAVVSGVSPTLTNLTLTGNLTVQGATTTIDSTTIQVKDKFVFEGATADAHETTLQVTEPTADRTITLPNASGTVAFTSDIPDVTGKTDKATLDATGAMYYASSANTPAKLAIGTNAQQLRVSSGGIPEWFTPAVAGGVPTGTVIQIASTSAPAGYLKANGSAISRTTYSDLFTAIGTVFGVGDGSTTFNIPDMRGYFTRNWADDYVGADRNRDNGRSFGSAQDSTGLFTSYGSSLVFDSDGVHSTGNYYPFIQQTGSTNNASAMGIKPKNMALLAVIKY